MNLETLTTFLGWCAVINIGVLIFVVLFWMACKEPFSKMFATMFGVTPDDAKLTVLRVVMQYRIAVVFFTIIPWVALKIMG